MKEPVVAYEFPENLTDEQLIYPKHHARLPGCGSKWTFYAWVNRGLFSATKSSAKRIKLPSLKVGGSKVTTVAAHRWWVARLQE